LYEILTHLKSDKDDIYDNINKIQIIMNRVQLLYLLIF